MDTVTAYPHLTDEHRELLARTEKVAAQVLAPLAAAGVPGEINRPLLAEARLLVQSAATAYDAGAGIPQSSAVAKLFATETAQHAVDVAIEVHGARALERGHVLEHLYREVRAPRSYEGTSEIQREIIARSLFRSMTNRPPAR
ncbi:MAG TPA: acyl-CoA dehydrogenase family protein [Kribbellaceae bacterium]|jgi:hypothetical protein